MFGAGGGTSSYQEVEETDLILLWGSNARETHPIFFHHLLKGLHHGARLFAVDPRRTSSAQWAEHWAALDVGSDIALANAMGREIIAAGLQHREFIANATEGFEAYRAAVEPCTLAWAERETGVSAEMIRTMAHAYARAERAMICWTLGITEHHNGVDNVLALVNLSLLTGHVGRYGSGLNPLRGQNNVQGGGDMGALPDRLPGFQHVENDPLRAKFDRAWGVAVPPEKGWHLSQMFEAMERGALRALYVVGENPLQSEADQHHVRHLLEGLDCLIVQDLFLTATAQLADVVLPARAAWCESEGTVTNSERRVQRVRKALDAPAGTRDDLAILFDLARRLGHDWGRPDAETVWNELRSLSAHARRHELRAAGEARRPAVALLRRGAPGRAVPAQPAVGVAAAGSARGVPAGRARPAGRPPRRRVPAAPDHRSAARRLQHRRADLRRTPRRCAAARPSTSRPRTRIATACARARWSGCGRAAARSSAGAPGRGAPAAASTFMTLHFQDEVATNLLTIDATDPKSGTAEFKATAICIERLGA